MRGIDEVGPEMRSARDAEGAAAEHALNIMREHFRDVLILASNPTDDETGTDYIFQGKGSTFARRDMCRHYVDSATE